MEVTDEEEEEYDEEDELLEEDDEVENQLKNIEIHDYDENRGENGVDEEGRMILEEVQRADSVSPQPFAIQPIRLIDISNSQQAESSVQVAPAANPMQRSPTKKRKKKLLVESKPSTVNINTESGKEDEEAKVSVPDTRTRSPPVKKGSSMKVRKTVTNIGDVGENG